jgi:hypothetical protein
MRDIGHFSEEAAADNERTPGRSQPHHSATMADPANGDPAINAISDANISALASHSSGCHSPDRRSRDRSQGHSHQGHKPTLSPESRRCDTSAL